jgi:hypothetical protein
LGPQLGGQTNGFLATASFTDYLNVWRILQDSAKAASYQAVVIYQEH